MKLKINHLAVLVCIILMHVLGFLWYGPLFGEKWMSLVGLDLATIEANPPSPTIWIMNLVASVSAVYMLAWLLARLNVVSGVTGAVIGFLCAFCFHHVTLMNSNMFAGEHYGLAWIVGGYSLVAMALSGFILGMWTKNS